MMARPNHDEADAAKALEKSKPTSRQALRRQNPSAKSMYPFVSSTLTDSQKEELLKRCGESRLTAGARLGGDDASASPEAHETANGMVKSRSSMNFFIPTQLDMEIHVHDVHGQQSWQFRYLSWLHSKPVQTTLMLLLIADVLILFSESFLHAQYPPCHIIERDGISCCNPFNHSAATAHEKRWLQSFLLDSERREEEKEHDSHENGTNTHDLECPRPDQVPMVPSSLYPVTCDEHKWHVIHVVEQVFFVCTILILTTFLVELTVTMIALTPVVFFRQFFYVLDLFIIFTSLVLELTFYALNDTAAQTVAGLLVISRLWRFIRIGHGIVSVSHELAQERYAMLLSYTEELEGTCFHRI
jgi:hypothetical protein